LWWWLRRGGVVLCDELELFRLGGVVTRLGWSAACIDDQPFMKSKLHMVFIIFLPNFFFKISVNFYLLGL
jgi:hypothetical protein